MIQPLTLQDISDLRAYERERDGLRNHVIAIKKRRRVGLGPIMSLVFENRDTMRFQVQEMVRAERMLDDRAVQHELDTYNALLPRKGELSATLFIELTSKPEMLEWLPKLVGIERSIELRLEGGERIRSVPEEEHEKMLTREEITPSVHFIRFKLTDDQLDRFAHGRVTLASAHPAYQLEAELPEETKQELVKDLRGEA